MAAIGVSDAPVRTVDSARRATRPLVATTITALALAAAYLRLAKSGTDLSAQVARADFFAQHGLHPIDFHWYGGVDQFGYSLLTPAIMASLTARGAGAVACVLASLAFAGVLHRTGVARPTLGGIAGALCIFGNLVSGRTTYAIGLAFGLLAVLALTDRVPARRRVLVAAAAVLASASSPVAGLFVGLVAVVLILLRRLGDGLALGFAAAVPIVVVSVLFGEGGWMNMSESDLNHGLILTFVTAVVVRQRAIRLGALIYGLGEAAAYTFHTPVGLNVIRLAVMFAIPLIVACCRWRTPIALVLAAAVGWWQPPVMLSDWSDRGQPTADPAYFAPLNTELRVLAPTGRVEVPPLRDYWESAYVVGAPLARGWLRQVDIGSNPIFFGGPISAANYREWLTDNAVEYVAVPRAPQSWVGRREAILIAGGVPYLQPVWRSPAWTLYAVAGRPAIAAAPATVLDSDPTGITLRLPRAASLEVKVRYSRWLTVSPHACLAADGRWTRISTDRGGTFRLSSALTGRAPVCRR